MAVLSPLDNTVNLSPFFFICLGAATVVYIVKLFYDAFSSPLFKIPGGWDTAFTSYGASLRSYNAKQVKHIHSLHQKHGSIVRTGYNSVDISTKEAVKTIYNVRETYIKDREFYARFPSPKRDSIFTTADVNHHRILRRLLSNPMADTSLRNFEPSIVAKVNKTMECMKAEMSANGYADIYKWFMFMTGDVISELAFGEAFGNLEIGQYTEYSKAVAAVSASSAISSTFPWLYATLRRIPFISIRGFHDASQQQARLTRYAEESLDRHKRYIERNPAAQDSSLLSRLLVSDGADEKTGYRLTQDDIISNARTYIIAGTDTTATTLTYLVWEVCRHPIIRQKLLYELNTIERQDVADEKLRQLKYLSQVIDETLRLHSVVEAGLPRVVPEGGATFEGHYLPAGTVVTSQSHSLNRDESVYPDAESFNPDRWEKPSKVMKEMSLAWGGGARVCIGIHLAKMELRHATYAFFTSFPNSVLSSKEGMCDADMDRIIRFLAAPRHERCLMTVQ